ncbi:hypothetical protein B566_EDAN002538 [Ephemera danica]|nr:hypothetical protein B566_EDAN002538 [Ephemera danica]
MNSPGVSVANEIGGHNLILSVAQNALERSLRSGLDCSLDVIITGILAKPEKIHKIKKNPLELLGWGTYLTVRSTTETSWTGTRKAMPVSLPLSSGMTLPTALAAPVDAGMMF